MESTPNLEPSSKQSLLQLKAPSPSLIEVSGFGIYESATLFYKDRQDGIFLSMRKRISI